MFNRQCVYIIYHIAGKFDGDIVWQKWMDKDFGEKKFGKLIDQPKGY